MPQTDEFKDDRPGVTGIGGIFFYSENPEETKSWYATHLGLKTNPWGSTFEFRNANAPDKVNYLQWSPFEKGSPYFAPSSNEFMINYRVRHWMHFLPDFGKTESKFWMMWRPMNMVGLSIYSIQRVGKLSSGNPSIQC